MTDLTSRSDTYLLDDPIEWGRRLIHTEDHDPIYSMLAAAEDEGTLDRPTLKRWLFAYWCCYDAGVSSYLALKTGDEFWSVLRTAAENKIGPDVFGANAFEERWPRAAERRHWRGDKASHPIDWAKHRKFTPEGLVDFMTINDKPGVVSQRDIVKRTTQVPQMGPWIAFKIADMAERVLGRPVTFSNRIVTLYRDPRKGAEMAMPLLGVDNPEKVGPIFLEAYRYMDAPPRLDRKVNIQEVETVLCKWKSARNGRYKIGTDTKHLRSSLSNWGDLASSLQDFVPRK